MLFFTLKFDFALLIHFFSFFSSPIGPKCLSCKIIKIIRGQNPEMMAHGSPAMDAGMDPMMASQGEMPPQNMPAAGPAGMPPGGMPMPGPMGGM